MIIFLINDKPLKLNNQIVFVLEEIQKVFYVKKREKLKTETKSEKPSCFTYTQTHPLLLNYHQSNSTFKYLSSPKNSSSSPVQPTQAQIKETIESCRNYFPYKLLLDSSIVSLFCWGKYSRRIKLASICIM